MGTGRVKLLAVVGPTASGKTALGVSLARRLNGEVISADSMQIYSGMDIATAKPSAEEMRGVPHHLIGFLDPKESFSVARFCELANTAADDILSRGRLPVVVGGTGLYIDHFLTGTKLIDSSKDEAVRNELQQRLEEEGAEALLKELAAVDPTAAQRIHPHNTVRIVRALELFRMTGMTVTEQNDLSRKAQSRFEPLIIGLDFLRREMLYRRIDARVDAMLEKGLLKEAAAHFAMPRSQTSSAAIGYKEMKPYLDGEKDLPECVAALKTATRHYAKRQMTWFKKNKDIRWFYPDRYDGNEAFEDDVYLNIREFFV